MKMTFANHSGRRSGKGQEGNSLRMKIIYMTQMLKTHIFSTFFLIGQFSGII